MTRARNLVAAAAAAAILAAIATPASAVSIKHTNRAGGDPEASAAPTGHTPPPPDTTGPHAFDKAHDNTAR